MSLLQERLESCYESERLRVNVPVDCRWSAKKWEQQLKAWQTESGAVVIAWPPNWRNPEGGGAKELWIFPGVVCGKSSRAYAEKRIRMKFDEDGALDDDAVVAGPAVAVANAETDGASAGVGSTAGTPIVAAGAEGRPPVSWSKYQDLNGYKYWYREPDGKWFYEGDKKWNKFFHDVNQRYWWWETDTGDWFYEPPSKL